MVCAPWARAAATACAPPWAGCSSLIAGTLPAGSRMPSGLDSDGFVPAGCDDCPVPSLTDLARQAGLKGPDLDWLHALLSDWQLLADLSFADLVLWAPLPEGGWLALAQMRPTTAPTAFPGDVVGTLRAGSAPVPLLTA